MARSGPKLSQILTAVQIVQVLGNINWKAYINMWNQLKAKLPQYWGRLLLVGFAGALVVLVAYDWRRAHVDKAEAQAAIVSITAERDALIRERDAELVARAQRAETMARLTEEQVTALAEVKAIMEENREWASQPLPDALRRRLEQ
jgi:hypothetical protein